MKRSDEAEDTEEGSSTMQDLDAHLAEFDESYRLREVLLHDYGIESEEDWLKWKQASAIIRKQNRSLWLTPTLKARNASPKRRKRCSTGPRPLGMTAGQRSGEVGRIPPHTSITAQSKPDNDQARWRCCLG